MRHTYLFATLMLVSALLSGCADNSRQKEIEQRRQALKEKQETSLAQAQQDLARVDSMLEAAKMRHDAQHKFVMEHVSQLKDDSPEVVELNRLRARRDSLETEWKTLGAKIKYIRKMQEKGASNQTKSTD